MNLFLIMTSFNPDLSTLNKLTETNSRTTFYLTGVKFEKEKNHFQYDQWVPSKTVIDYAKANNLDSFKKQFGTHYIRTLSTGFKSYIIEKVSVDIHCALSKNFVISEIEIIKGIRGQGLYTDEELSAKAEALKVHGIKRDFFFISTHREQPITPIKTRESLEEYLELIKDENGDLPLTATNARLMEIDAIYSELRRL